MKSMPSILWCGVLVVCLAASHGKADDTKTEALNAATSWLLLVDSGQYGDSWDQSAKLFKAALTKTRWEQSLNAVRKPLGDLIRRKMMSAQYTTSLPGAPDGEYVVIQFATRFANKKSAVETVTPMKDPDGVWRVSGYYIR